MSRKRVIISVFVAVLLLSAAVPAQPGPGGPLERLSEPQHYKAMRQSSYDPSGGNQDGRQDWPIEPGETRELAVIEGPGAINHIWVTIASPDENHLKNLAIRMYWDGEETPSVEGPIGDFFGLGNGTYYQYSSMPIQIGTQNGLNCFWRMPFATGARVTVTNDGPVACRAFYYYVNYQVYDAPPASPMRFHAQYRQEYPCTPGENYVFLEAEGRGHYIGCNLSIHNRNDGWWGEGDDMIYVDGEDFPSLHGTGSEDYFCGAWCYGPAFSNLYFGCPQRGEHAAGALWNVYRYHIEDPVPFTKSIRVTIEHGHDNDRNDDFSSMAYWYQEEPHAPFPPLPPAEERLPGELGAPYKEPGAMEMEEFVRAFRDNRVSVQDLSMFTDHWSDNKHVWFRPEAPEVFEMELDVPASDAGEQTIKLWYTRAPDYGQAELWANGVKVAEWDGYNDSGVIRDHITFDMEVKAGANLFELKIVGKNERSSGYYAGIDCISQVLPQ